MAPVAHEILRAQIQSHIDSNKVMIFSKSTCPYCKKVKSFFESNGEAFFALELDLIEEGDALHEVLIEMTNHKTVPNVFVNGTHIGGCDDTIKAYEEGRVQKLLTAHTYDYDLVVIGGGSGGLACAKEAAGLGKKVAVLDFVQPTPIGTTWGLGGTCVNVGCIPKKLMHQASLLGEAVKESAHYGWKPSENMVHSWETMKENVQNHIGSLNWNYRVQLREKSVNYLNMLGQFVGDHKIKVTKKNGSSEEVTAERFVVAVGGRPNYPNIPGAKEFGITSDDVFSLPYCPGKTVVVGASYVALECAGFLAGLGMDVTVMVRSILLRGFDQDMAARIGAYMESHGIKFIREAVPTKVEKVKEGNPGTLRVNYRYVDGTEAVEECSTILFAIGRTAITEPLNLGSVGVKVSPENQKILTKQEQSSVPYIYAIGDCIQEATMPGKGMLELTPVAIKAGQLLARRLYDKSSVFMDYNNIPTTVFTPLEYGAIGYSEDAALEEFGDNIEVYHSYFWPLEWTVSHREENACYAKLICLKSDRERVIGLHVLSPNAGEITQGYAVGMRLGATKNDFSMTVGIHPTNSEIFTTLSVSKSSGSSVEAGGC